MGATCLIAYKQPLKRCFFIPKIFNGCRCAIEYVTFQRTQFIRGSYIFRKVKYIFNFQKLREMNEYLHCLTRCGGIVVVTRVCHMSKIRRT